MSLQNMLRSMMKNISSLLMQCHSVTMLECNIVFRALIKLSLQCYKFQTLMRSLLIIKLSSQTVNLLRNLTKLSNSLIWTTHCQKIL
jgi:hypothetical protein